jgi:DeoR/GlpR family transcriptional regulator of sugar metabolism
MQEESTLLAIERQRIIRDLLEREGVVRSAELTAILHVSTVTIRADLRELENAGVCEIIWGGATYRQPPTEPEPLLLTKRSKLHTDEKQRIGGRAAQLVESGQTLFVDAGSTTVAMIRSLPPDLESLRVVTPAMNVATAAMQFPQIELVMSGGVLRNLTYSLIGPQVIRSLEQFNADWAFVASGGITVEQGVTTSNILEAEVKTKMIERARRVALLADHSKFGKALSLTAAPLRDIDVVITGRELADADAEALEAAGVQVIRV